MKSIAVCVLMFIVCGFCLFRYMDCFFVAFCCCCCYWGAFCVCVCECVCVWGGGGLNLRAKVLFGRHVFPCLRKHYSEVDLHLVSAYHATTGQFLECLVDCVFWVLTQCGIHLVVATELV